MDKLGINIRDIGIFLLILSTNILINLIDNVSGDNPFILSSITMMFISTFTMSSYITLLDRPIHTVILLDIAQLLSILNSLFQGNRFGVAIINNGLLLIVGIIITIIQIRKTRTKKIFQYKRKPIQVKLWVHIIVWSLFITSIGYTANGNVMKTLNHSASIRVYGALSIILPSILLVMLFTTSILSYEFLILYMIIHTYTIYLLYVMHELNISSSIYIILQDSIIIYSFIKYLKERKKVRTNENIKNK